MPVSGIISVMEQRVDLPDDIETLRDMVIQLQGEIHCLKSQKGYLQEQIRLLLHKRFGAQSEKYPVAQSDLFNEAEAYAEDGSESIAPADTLSLGNEATESSAGAVSSEAPSAKRGRKALPKELPRVDIIHELPEPQRHCPEGHALVVIGEEVSEQLDIIPAKIQVLRHLCPVGTSARNTLALAAVTASKLRPCHRSRFRKATPHRLCWPLSSSVNSSMLCRCTGRVNNLRVLGSICPGQPLLTG